MPIILGLIAYGFFQGLLQGAKAGNNYLLEQLQKNQRELQETKLAKLNKPNHEMVTLQLYVDSTVLQAKAAEAAAAPIDTIDGIRSRCEFSAVVLQGVADVQRTS